MSAPPYMKLYWADYHQDTRHLTREEHGAYFLLLGEAWNRGGYLPDDDVLLARWALATPREWERLKPVILAYFRPAPKGRWRHKRIAEELASYDEISRKRKAAGRKGGSVRHGNDSENPQANAIAIAKQKPTKPEPEPEPRKEEEREGSLVLPFPLPAAPPEGGQAARTRGSRLKADWQPSADNLSYAVKEGFTLPEVTRMAEAFRDYWTAASGSKATKLDWSAAWRTWTRNERDRRNKSQPTRRQVDWC